MPSQHKHPPISLRLPEPDRERLLAHAKRTGRAVNALVAAAVTEWLDRQGGTTLPPAPPEGGKTTRARRPAAKASAAKNSGPEGAEDIAAFFRRRNGGQG